MLKLWSFWSWTKLLTVALQRHAHTFTFSLASLMLSASIKRPVCGTHNVKAGSGMWWCVKDRCFGGFMRGKQEVIPPIEGWHMAHGFHLSEIKHKFLYVSFVLQLVSQRFRRWWEWYTPIDSPVKHCTIVCILTSLLSPTPDSGLISFSSFFMDEGSVFESLFLSTLWSIYPIMNEEAVKGWKAGVHLCVCVHTLSWAMSFLLT